MTTPITPTLVEAALLTDPDVRLVLDALAGPDDDLRPYLRTIARDIAMPVEQLRRIVKKLGDERLATYGPVVDAETGWPCGSTWWLTERGVALRDLAEQGAGR